MASKASPVRSWRSRTLFTVVLLLILLPMLFISLLASLPKTLPPLLAKYGIELQLKQPRWHTSGLSLERLLLRFGTQQLQLEQLQLGWSWLPLHLQQLSAEQLSGTLQLSAAGPGDSSSQPMLDLSSYQRLLPEQLDINQIDIQINQQARLTGQLSLHIQSTTDNWQLHQTGTSQLQLHALQPQLAGFHASQASISLTGARLDIPPQRPTQLQFDLSLNGQLKQLEHAWLYPQDWRLSSSLSGNLQTLHSQWQLLGSQGLELSARASWQHQQLTTELELTSTNLIVHNPLAHTLRNWPNNYVVDQGEYSANATLSYHNQQASGQLSASINRLNIKNAQQQADNLSLKLSAQAQLQLADEPGQWLLSFNSAGVSFVMDKYRYQQHEFVQLAGSLILQGELNPQQLHLSLSQPAYLRSQASHLFNQFRSQQSNIHLNQLALQQAVGTGQPAQLQAQLDASIQKLRSPLLKAQNWSLSSQIEGNTQQLHSQNLLISEQGLQLQSQLRGNLQHFHVNSQLSDIYFNQGNPLQQTLQNWPELLSLHSGTLSSQLHLEYRYQQPVSAQLNSRVSKLSGIYNSSELKDVNIKLDARLNNQQLSASLPIFSIAAINPGIPLSDIRIQGAHFNSQPGRAGSSRLSWQKASARLLNGSLYSNQHSLQAMQDSPIQINLEGLELQELLHTYPMEGLAGSGIIDGQLPLLVNPEGISIEQGHLAARKPGHLQFQSAQLDKLAQTNPAIKILSDAMQDFYFNALKSTVNFDKNGKLLLGMRIEGYSPGFENGRPIHLNFNLEQNLFALLASIQLNNRVSEQIIKRIRQRAEQRYSQ